MNLSVVTATVPKERKNAAHGASRGTGPHECASPKGAKETPAANVESTEEKPMVPSKGLEPPHPCEYMDLNHARLPIPPRWHVD